MIEAKSVLKVCCKTRIAVRRIALQMIQMKNVSAPDELRDQIRHFTRMQLLPTLALSRSDVTAYRYIQDVYRFALKSLARNYLQLHYEIADLGVMITSIVDEQALNISKINLSKYSESRLLITAR